MGGGGGVCGATTRTEPTKGISSEKHRRIELIENEGIIRKRMTYKLDEVC